MALSSTRASIVLGLIAAVLAACKDDGSAVRHRSLAEGFHPSVSTEPFELTAPVEGAPPLTLTPDGQRGYWIEARYPAETWKRRGPAGFWVASRHLAGSGGPEDGSARQRFTSGGRELDYVSVSEGLARPDDIAPGSFCAAGELVYVFTGSDEGPPGESVLREYLSRGAAEGTNWRVKVGRFSAEGLPVLPGRHEELTCDLPAGSSLRFSTAAVGFRGDATEGPTLVFRVRLNGEVWADFEQEVSPQANAVFRNLALPEEHRRGLRDARLRFEVLGQAAQSAFLTPTVGPAEIGTYGARPWETRPDLVVFLADTFRADNLACYGGDPRLTPNLDRFAAGSVRFQRAWSTSTWTLPSHAAMFASLYPYQSGVLTERTSLAPGAETVAERLRAAGYRTGAVTDHAFVSSTFGLAQGFEWFDEEWSDLADMQRGVERFLAADDGRPIFLFVHTYRTHIPYHVSDETRELLGEHLGLRGDWDSLLAEGDEIQARFGSAYEHTEEFARFRDGYEALYRGGVADLDRGFETLRLELAERGLLESGYLLFTSDHGEGFWEHGIAGHGVGMYEEHLRIPLLIAGGTLEPRVVSAAATHVDLAPTLTALAQLGPSPAWQGVNLLALEQDRAALSFQCSMWDDPSTMSVVSGDRKIVAPAEPAALLRRPRSQRLRPRTGSRGTDGRFRQRNLAWGTARRPPRGMGWRFRADPRRRRGPARPRRDRAAQGPGLPRR